MQACPLVCAVAPIEEEGEISGTHTNPEKQEVTDTRLMSFAITKIPRVVIIQVEIAAITAGIVGAAAADFGATALKRDIRTARIAALLLSFISNYHSLNQQEKSIGTQCSGEPSHVITPYKPTLHKPEFITTCPHGPFSTITIATEIRGPDISSERVSGVGTLIDGVSDIDLHAPVPTEEREP